MSSRDASLASPARWAPRRSPCARLEQSGSTVAIVVAWELCWYRYEVDLGDEAAGLQLVGQGMELEELPMRTVANAALTSTARWLPLALRTLVSTWLRWTLCAVAGALAPASAGARRSTIYAR